MVPTEVERLNDEAGAFLTQGRAREALRLLDLALKLDPDNPLLVFNHARIQKSAGRAREAEVELRRILSLGEETVHPNLRADSLVLLGLIQYEAGLLPEAEASYRAALELDPENADAWNDLGVLAFVQGDYRAARSRFAAAVRVDSGLTSAWLNLEDACEELNDWEGRDKARRREIFTPE